MQVAIQLTNPGPTEPETIPYIWNTNDIVVPLAYLGIIVFVMILSWLLVHYFYDRKNRQIKNRSSVFSIIFLTEGLASIFVSYSLASQFWGSVVNTVPLVGVGARVAFMVLLFSAEIFFFSALIASIRAFIKHESRVISGLLFIGALLAIIIYLIASYPSLYGTAITLYI